MLVAPSPKCHTAVVPFRLVLLKVTVKGRAQDVVVFAVKEATVGVGTNAAPTPAACQALVVAITSGEQPP